MLRSEQDSASPIIGDPLCWERLLGPEVKLTTLDAAFMRTQKTLYPMKAQSFPFLYCLKLIKNNPRLIIPGLQLSTEIVRSYIFNS